MVTKVSALLKTVKSVEDEAGRGVRLLESTIDRIDAEIKVFQSNEVCSSGCSTVQCFTCMSCRTMTLTVLQS